MTIIKDTPSFIIMLKHRITYRVHKVQGSSICPVKKDTALFGLAMSSLQDTESCQGRDCERGGDVRVEKVVRCRDKRQRWKVEMK